MAIDLRGKQQDLPLCVLFVFANIRLASHHSYIQYAVYVADTQIISSFQSMTLYWERDARSSTSAKKAEPKSKQASQGAAVIVPGCHFPDPRKPKKSSSAPYYKEMANYSDYAHCHDERLDRHFAGLQLRPAGQAVMMEGDRCRSMRLHDQDHNSSHHVEHSFYSSHQIHSVAIRPGTRLYPSHRHTHSYRELSLPFTAAAQQLERTTRQALMFFEDFRLTFRETTGDLTTHASDDLLNKIWQSQITASSSEPAYGRYGKKDTRIQDAGIPRNHFQQPHFHQQHMCANNITYEYDSKPRRPSPMTEILSFCEYQTRVLSRIEAFLRSRMPVLPATATYCVALGYPPHGRYHHNHHDPEVTEGQRRYCAVQTLHRKIRDSYKDIKEAIGAMGKDHRYAKQAIHEMKIVKQHLETYRQAWDPKGEGKDEWDSDDEVKRLQGRDNRRQWMSGPF